ncbi:MAG TPA: hypothetical protein VFS21_03275 [Roseiflexaceae bacterium]|nr:hypothetical protein [Roseiflexaceae bacterium]
MRPKSSGDFYIVAEGEEIQPEIREYGQNGSQRLWPPRLFRVIMSGTQWEINDLGNFSPETAIAHLEADKSYQLSPEIDNPSSRHIRPARYFASVLIFFQPDNTEAAEGITTLKRKVQHYKGTIVELKEKKK